ncbi:unnamed protein product [Ixodes persulcatus]
MFSYFMISETLLTQFVSQMPGLYGYTAMTFNIHQLVHLCSTVRCMGPLWANSAFRFEDGNGRLLNHVTAAKGVPQQIVERVIMRKELETLLSADFLPASVKRKCQRVLGYDHLRSATYVQEACLLGSGMPVQSFSVEETAAMHSRIGFCPSGASEHERFVVKHQVYHNTQYGRAKKSNSSVICCNNEIVAIIIEALHVEDMNMECCVLLCTPLRQRVVHNSIFPVHIVETGSSGQSVVAVLPEDMHIACV